MGPSSTENCTEVYSYKVIYPGGTFVRVSPAQNAAKTGDILEHGSIFESSKSLFLDGINYVKLDDGRGWVFDSKGDTKVLDLIEVCRRQSNDASPTEVVESVKYQSKPQINQSRVQNLYWREIRSKARRCISFHEFSKLSCEGVTLRPPSVPEPGPARSVWMSESHSDLAVRKCIMLIASTTRKGAHSVSDINDLESHLWVLIHMGNQIGHVMQLVQDEANIHFEILNPDRRNELLSVALEVGAATRAHTLELGKHVDILADDIRNFIQRWVIIKSYRTDDNTSPIESPSITSAYLKEMNKNIPPEVRIKRCVPPDMNLIPTTNTWMSSWVCGQPTLASPRSPSSEGGSSTHSNGSNNSRDSRISNDSTLGRLTTMFEDLSTYVKKVTTDPEYQFAGII